MQTHVNLVDLVKSFPMNIFLKILASIQQRTSLIKFDHLDEKSEYGSISNLSTKILSRFLLMFTVAIMLSGMAVYFQVARLGQLLGKRLRASFCCTPQREEESCVSCRSRRALSNEVTIAGLRVGIDENEFSSFLGRRVGDSSYPGHQVSDFGYARRWDVEVLVNASP